MKTATRGDPEVDLKLVLNPLRRHSSLEMRSPVEYEHRYWEDNAIAAAADAGTIVAIPPKRDNARL